MHLLLISLGMEDFDKDIYSFEWKIWYHYYLTIEFFYTFKYLSHNKLSNSKLVEHFSFLNDHMKRTIFSYVVWPIPHALFLKWNKKICTELLDKSFNSFFCNVRSRQAIKTISLFCNFRYYLAFVIHATCTDAHDIKRTNLTVFRQTSKHDYASAFYLPNHSPEINNSLLSEGTCTKKKT